MEKIATNVKKLTKKSQKFDEKMEIRKRCKAVHCVDLGESFPTSIYLQNLLDLACFDTAENEPYKVRKFELSRI